MKTKISWFDRIMAAVTFAEANEHAQGKMFLIPDGELEKKQNCKECEVVLTTEPARG
jgi:hypothetical protein